MSETVHRARTQGSAATRSMQFRTWRFQTSHLEAEPGAGVHLAVVAARCLLLAVPLALAPLHTSPTMSRRQLQGERPPP